MLIPLITGHYYWWALPTTTHLLVGIAHPTTHSPFPIPHSLSLN
ncbi:hypothetical protein [Egbenema bharatensis]